MADANKLLRALLGKGYKMPKTEIDKLLSDETTDEDGETQIIEGDVARIGKLTQPKKGETFQDGYKKAKAEERATLEKEIKEHFEIETDATGVDLIGEIVTVKAKTEGKPKELTDDDVKKHPVYQNAEKAHKAALKQTQTEWETKLNERETQYKKGETFNTVASKALAKLNGMNPVIPANAKVAANIQRSFLDGLKGFDYEVQGDRIVVMKDGKVVDDGHGHSLDFDKLIEDHAGGFYEFKANNGGGNGGNGNQEKDKGGPGAGGGTGPVYPANINKPKTWEEVNVIVNNTSIPANDRAIVLQVWEQESKSGS